MTFTSLYPNLFSHPFLSSSTTSSETKTEEPLSTQNSSFYHPPSISTESPTVNTVSTSSVPLVTPVFTTLYPATTSYSPSKRLTTSTNKNSRSCFRKCLCCTKSIFLVLSLGTILFAAISAIWIAHAYYRTIIKPVSHDITGVSLFQCGSGSSSPPSIESCMDSDIILSVNLAHCGHHHHHCAPISNIDADIYLLPPSTSSILNISSTLTPSPVYLGSSKLAHSRLFHEKSHIYHDFYHSPPPSLPVEKELDDEHQRQPKHEHKRKYRLDKKPHPHKTHSFVSTTTMISLPSGATTNLLLTNLFAESGTVLLIDLDFTLSRHIFYGHQYHSHLVNFNSVESP